MRTTIYLIMKDSDLFAKIHVLGKRISGPETQQIETVDDEVDSKCPVDKK